jgi:hypothetical protein
LHPARRPVSRPNDGSLRGSACRPPRTGDHHAQRTPPAVAAVSRTPAAVTHDACCPSARATATSRRTDFGDRCITPNETASVWQLPQQDGPSRLPAALRPRGSRVSAASARQWHAAERGPAARPAERRREVFSLAVDAERPTPFAPELGCWPPSGQASKLTPGLRATGPRPSLCRRARERSGWLFCFTPSAFAGRGDRDVSSCRVPAEPGP